MEILTLYGKGFDMTKTKEAMSLAVEIGDEMLRNGAEIYRVEDTVIHKNDRIRCAEVHRYVLCKGE